MSILEHLSEHDEQDILDLPLRAARARFERAYFLGLLLKNRANVTRTLEESGMGDRGALNRKLNLLGLTAEVRRRIRRGDAPF